MLLSQAIAGFWLTKQIDLSGHTVRDYSLHFDRLVDFLNDPEFDSIQADDLRRFLVYVQKEYNLGKKTVANTWIALSSLWTWAEAQRGYAHVIRGKIKRPKYQTREIEPLEPTEIRAMIDAAQYNAPYTTRNGHTARGRRPTALRDTAILLTLLDSGLRAQELCDLQVRDYDRLKGRVHVQRGKGDKERFIPLGQRSQQAIQGYLRSRSGVKPVDPLFSTRTGNHLDRDNLGNLLERLALQAGVADAHPHKWRHSYAINFLRSGGNALLLQKLLGHSSLEMVQRYIKFVEHDITGAGKFSPADRMLK